MPNPILVGRNTAKLNDLAKANGIDPSRIVTDLDAALADKENTIYFDAPRPPRGGGQEGYRGWQACLLRETDNDEYGGRVRALSDRGEGRSETGDRPG